jgi:hypothetical protein
MIHISRDIFSETLELCQRLKHMILCIMQNKCYISGDIFGETLSILSMTQTHDFVYNA